MTSTTWQGTASHRVPFVYALVVIVVAVVAAAIVAFAMNSSGSGSGASTRVHEGTSNGSVLTGVPCPGNQHDLSC
jgi:hypothetical protein